MKVKGTGLAGYGYEQATSEGWEWLYGKDLPTMLGVPALFWEKLLPVIYVCYLTRSPVRGDERIALVVRHPAPQLFGVALPGIQGFIAEKEISTVLDLVPPSLMSVAYTQRLRVPLALRGRYVPADQYGPLAYTTETQDAWEPYILLRAGDADEMQRQADRLVRRRDQHLYRHCMARGQPLEAL